MDRGSGSVAGLAVVSIVGLAGSTVTCSALGSLSLTMLLLASPL